MRIYYDIDLTSHRITGRELHGEEIVRAGRYWIAKTLLELGADQNSTVVFPLPLDIVGPWLNNLTRGGAGAVENAAENGTGPARVVP
jgi:hypothetical protein